MTKERKDSQQNILEESMGRPRIQEVGRGMRQRLTNSRLKDLVRWLVLIEWGLWIL